MAALIGYLVTLAVFLGGGYAGMQWLTAPVDIPAAVALHRSIEPVKSTRAMLLARKRHEAAAEREASATPMATTVPPVEDEAASPTVESAVMTVGTESTIVNEPVQPREVPRSVTVADTPVDKPTVVSSPVSTLGTANAKTAESKPAEKKVGRAVLTRDEGEATGSRRISVLKRRAATRLASRKPVLMILRTIEFPDGRREQRLLPMPRYRQAFADD